MAFSIDEFKGDHFSNDFYRANLFEVNIYGDVSDIKMMVKGASIPASTVDAVEVPFQNRIIKIAGDRTFEDWTVTVYNDADFKYRSELESWMDEIQSHSRTVGDVPDLYVGSLEVKPIKRNGALAGDVYTFHNAFPTAIDAIDLTWGTDGAPSEYGVTFAYSHWTKGASTS